MAKGKLVAETDIIRKKDELLFLDGKPGKRVSIRSTKANRKGAKRGGKKHCISKRGGKPTKRPCGYVGRKAAKKPAAKKPAAKKPAKRRAKRTARKPSAYGQGRYTKRGMTAAAKRGAFAGAARGATRTTRARTRGKTSFAKLTKAQRSEIGKKGARAAARARKAGKKGAKKPAKRRAKRSAKRGARRAR